MSKKEEKIGVGRNFILKSFMICALAKYNLCNKIKKKKTWHVLGRGEMHTEFWWGNLKNPEVLESLVLDWVIILEWFLKEYTDKIMTGFFWLRIGENGGLF